MINERNGIGMIYITGDTHAKFNGRFSVDNFPEQKNLMKEDYLIICGDFGGVWNFGGESASEKYWLDWFETRNYTLLFVDGNHENFDRLSSYPVEKWHGGTVHKLRSHVLHLMRGQIYEIDGKKLFTFGGAASHDISGGILDIEDPDFKRKKREFNKMHESYRVNHVTWWKQELASEEEMEVGKSNLKKYDYTVDYIVTHCCSTSSQRVLGRNEGYKADKQTDYLEDIKNCVNYKKWFFGHYHKNINLNEKEVLIYDQIIRIV